MYRYVSRTYPTVSQCIPNLGVPNARIPMYLAVSRVGIRIVHVFGMYCVRAVRIHATIHNDTCIEGKLSLFRGKTVPCPIRGLCEPCSGIGSSPMGVKVPTSRVIRIRGNHRVGPRASKQPHSLRSHAQAYQNHHRAGLAGQ